MGFYSASSSDKGSKFLADEDLKLPDPYFEAPGAANPFEDDEDDEDEDDEELEGQPLAIRVSRDTLVLIGALLFLVVAVGLTFSLKKPSNNSASSGASRQQTQVALGGSTTPVTGTVGRATPRPSGSPSKLLAYPTPTKEDLTPSPTLKGTPSPSFPFTVTETITANLSATPSLSSTLKAGPETYPPPRTGSTFPYPGPNGQPGLGGTMERGTPAAQPTQPTLILPPKTSPVPTLVETSSPRPAHPTLTPMPPLPTRSFPTQTLPTLLPTQLPFPTLQPATLQPATSVAKFPTSLPIPTQEPMDTGKAGPPTEEPTLTPSETLTPSPTIPPVTLLQGQVHLTVDKSPIVLEHPLKIAAGAEVIIDPGVELQLGFDVPIFVGEEGEEGPGAKLFVLGQPGRPVRISGTKGQQWDGFYVGPKSTLQLQNVEIRSGGSKGTLLASKDSKEIKIIQSDLSQNGGAVLIKDTPFEMRDSRLTDNTIPYDTAALNIVSNNGEAVTLRGNRIGGHKLNENLPNINIQNQSPFNPLKLDIQGNTLWGGANNLQLTTDGPIQGSIGCNALLGGNAGLSVRSQQRQILSLELQFVNNFIDEHTPWTKPSYSQAQQGIGRGATSEVTLDMRNNWWGSSTGPYQPEKNPEGKGDSVGNNILYEPWLHEQPACIPSP